MSNKQESSSENKPKRRGRPKKASVAKSKQVGDKIEEILNSEIVEPITTAVKKILFKNGEDCGCDERKEKLNEKFKRQVKPVRCLTEKNYNYLLKELPKINYPVMNELTKIHASVFNYQFRGACSSCSSRNRKIVNDLRSVLKLYEN